MLRSALPRLDALIAEGVTTVEIKSGYGLELATERKIAARRAAAGARRGPSTVRTTFLGAHALPPEYADRRDAYIALVADKMLPALAAEGLVDAVDGFCESIAFTREEIARVFEAARAARLAGQAARRAACPTAAARRWRPNSARCRPIISNISTKPASRRWRARASSRRCCPALTTSCARRQAPPVALFRKHGVPMAVATDCNPGTSPLTSLLLDDEHGGDVVSA